MRALVTGAGGFLGEYLCEQLLARGDQVRGFGRGDYPHLRAQGVEWVRGDIRDRAAVLAAARDIDVIYHTAALAGIWGRWQDFYDVNTLGTQHVLDACREHSIRRLVYTSSPSVTFDGVDQCGVDESAPYATRWLCAYPQTKALAEQAILQAHREGELHTCALRPHLIWGPRDQHLIPRLMDRARKGQLRRVGDGTNLIDAVHVENAAAAHLLAADRLVPGSPVGGRAYFITNGEPVNCWQWINDLLQRAGLPPVQRAISQAAAWRIGATLEVIWKLLGKTSEPRMTRFLAAQLATSHYFNIDRARQDLGYVPKVSMDEGMSRL